MMELMSGMYIIWKIMEDNADTTLVPHIKINPILT